MPEQQDVKPKKVYVYDRTRKKKCCFCGLFVRYDSLARHKRSQKCLTIRNLLQSQLDVIESGEKVVIPTKEVKVRKPRKSQSKKIKTAVEVENLNDK